MLVVAPRRVCVCINTVLLAGFRVCCSDFVSVDLNPSCTEGGYNEEKSRYTLEAPTFRLFRPQAQVEFVI